MCKKIGLDRADLEEMNIGQCLDYLQEWVENNQSDEDKEVSSRKATQADFDNF